MERGLISCEQITVIFEYTDDFGSILGGFKNVLFLLRGIYIYIYIYIYIILLMIRRLMKFRFGWCL